MIVVKEPRDDLNKVRNKVITEILPWSHYVNCKIKDPELVNSFLFRIVFENCDLSNTCLDPDATPNMEGDFQQEGEYCLGYRSQRSIYNCSGNIYKSGKTYAAPYFSVSGMACHPGLYVCPDIEGAQSYSSDIILVKFKREHLHKAGDKYRVKQFTVIGEVLC